MSKKVEECKELRRDLELVDVEMGDDGDTAILNFIDSEAGELYEVKYHKKRYNKETNKFEPNEEQEKWVQGRIKEDMGCSFEELGDQIGAHKDVYHYDNFNSLQKSDIPEKFAEDMVGQIIQAVIKNIDVDREGIRIKFDYDGKTYESKMGFTKKLDDKWYVDGVKKSRQENRFLNKFHVRLDEKEKLYGTKIMVEVKEFAANGAIYSDIKKLPKAK